MKKPSQPYTLLVLACVTVLAWLLPLRPTVSEEEKRPLAAFPEFSAQALFSGDYFAGIDTWFSDTFTLREAWLGLDRVNQALRGIRDTAVLPAGEDVQNDFVAHTAVLQVRDAAYAFPARDSDAAGEYAAVIGKLASELEGKARVFDLIVPESGSYMLSAEEKARYGFPDETDTLSSLRAALPGSVKSPDLLAVLEQHRGEYIAFRTDHHWTALGAYYAYEAWCSEAGKRPVPLSKYSELRFDGFLGHFTYLAGRNALLAHTPDTVFAYVPPGDVKLYLNFDNTDSLGSPSELIIDRRAASPGAKYLCFLGSDELKATFVNDSVGDGSACLLVKTSFGNPFAYYLTQHYQYVYVLDMRFYRERSIADFAETYGVEDVIIIHNSDLCADPEQIANLQALS